MSLLNKPRLMEKLKIFYNYVRKNDGKIGTKVRGIDVNFNNMCNFKCQHCFTRSPLGDNVKEELPLDKIEELADQADELGIFEFDLQGGELLLRPEKLYHVIKRIKPERFYLYLTTNGYLLNKEVAKKLAELGVSRVSVSIDSSEPEIHDEFRGVKGAHERALKALENVKEVGIDPYLNITVGKYNIMDEDIERLCKYSKDKGYSTLINVAVPSGRWLKKKDEVMIDEEGRKRLIELRKKYQNIIRDIWNPFDKKYEGCLGCNVVNRTYITPKGDVLACPYMHIKIGNIFQNTLKEIIDFGFSIKYFRDYSEKCLSGEDKGFVEKFMQDEDMTIFNPRDAKKIFKKEDFITNVDQNSE